MTNIAVSSADIVNGELNSTAQATARTALGLGTMSTQNASAVAITGGTIAGVAITTSSVSCTTLTASGLVTLSPANANVLIQPTGTGLVTIGPATAGSMNNMVIGNSTPLAITGTTITSTLGVTVNAGGASITGNSTVTGTLGVTGTASLATGSTNSLRIAGGGTGVGPVLYSEGETNVDLMLNSKGSNPIRLFTNSVAAPVEQLRVTHTASASRWVTITGSNGGNPTIGVSGGSLALSAATTVAGLITNTSGGVNISGTRSAGPSSSLYIDWDGADARFNTDADAFRFLTGSGGDMEQFRVLHTASATRYVTITGSNGGNPGIATSAGSLSINSVLALTNQTVGTTVGAAGGGDALPATPEGYITISINGTARKIPYYLT